MKQKLDARVVKSASGTEVFLTTPMVKDADGNMVPDLKTMLVNTVLHLPHGAEVESGLYQFSLEPLTLENVSVPVKKDEPAKV